MIVFSKSNKSGVFGRCCSLSLLLLLLLASSPAYTNAAFADFDLAYVAAEGGLWQVWLAHSGSFHKNEITASQVDLRSPSWSPDGAVLAYATAGGNLFIQEENKGPEQLDLLTVQNSEPAWSPDGSKIVYTSYTNPRAYQSELWTIVVKPDGKTQKHEKINIPEGLVAFPTWHEGMLTYSRLEEVRLTSVVENICSYDFKTGREKILISDGFDNIHPSWSPDGRVLAFASNKSGNFDIWLWNPAADSYEQITDDPAMDRYPSWSPDGGSIAFTSSRTGTAQVWIIDRATGSTRQIGFGNKGSRDPAWRNK